MAVCLVTGGAGFIGSHLVEALLDRGHLVRVLDNFSTGCLENLSTVEDHIELIRGSVADFDVVREATADAEYVFHLAAPTPGVLSLADLVGTHHSGATGTLHVLIAAREANVRRVVYASSSHVYGQAIGLPRREDEPTQPLSPYGVAKLTGEQQCLGFNRLYGLETVRLRYFNVFGPRQSAGSPYAGSLRQVLRQMLTGCRPVVPVGVNCRQDLIAVDDAVYATLLAVSTPRAAGKVYNIASGRPTTPLELVAALNDILGIHLAPVETFFGPPEDVCHLANPHKAEVELGFCAGTSLEKGLRECVEYYALRHEGAAPTLTG